MLAFDFGTRYLGVAVGEHAMRVAHPLTTIDGEANEVRFAAIGKLVDEWRPTILVVGVPRSIDGTPHDMTRRAERFARQLGGRFALPVARVDERLTSVEASEQLRSIGQGGRQSKSLVHPVAAQLILQTYFDSLYTPGGPGTTDP